MFQLPFRHVARPIAVLLLLIEHLSQLAAVAARYLTIYTHIEVLAVIGIGVTWMCDRHRLIHFGAFEFENVLRIATLHTDLIGPCANAGFGIEHQTHGTGNHIELSIDTVVEFITHTLLFMTEVAVFAWTML